MAISAPSSTFGNCADVMSGSRLMRMVGSSAFCSRSKITASDSLASTNTPRKTSLRVSHGCFNGLFQWFVGLGRNPGKRQHRMHQDVGAGGAIGLGGVLELVVADAVLAGHEHHRRGDARVE